MKDLHLVLLNYLSKDDVLTALDTIFKDISGSVFDIQITVADNSENKDGIKEAVAEKFPQIKYLDCGGNVGFGRGNTKALAEVPARYYFVLNPDARVPENTKTIERMINFMDEHPKIGCIGPKLLNPDWTLQFSCYRFDLPAIMIKPLKHIDWDRKYKWIKKYSDRLLMKDFDHNETRPVDWVQGSAMLVRKDVVDQIGWFDGRYFMYMEDCDWCRTMWEKGWPVYYIHDIIVLHAHARESAKVPGLINGFFKNKLARTHAISWLKYMWKWRGSHKYFSV